MDYQETLWGDTPPTRVSGKCRRCGRALSNPKSMQAGIGPICARKEAIEQEEEKVSSFTSGYIDVPMTEGVILERRNGETYTNVPHLVAHHSPTGYEWGYMGSGPTDLAFNIVENTLRILGYKGETTNQTWDKRRVFRLSFALKQEFKETFIVHVPHEGGVIPFDRISTWVKVRIAVDEAEGLDDSVNARGEG